jgi:hypothetical protein
MKSEDIASLILTKKSDNAFKDKLYEAIKEKEEMIAL